MDVTAGGVDRLIATLGAASDDLDTLEVAEERAGSFLAGVVRRTAPRRTGALAGSVAATIQGSLVQVTAGDDQVTYAAAVHKRNPWMTRAAAKNTDELVAIYAAEAAHITTQIKGT